MNELELHISSSWQASSDFDDAPRLLLCSDTSTFVPKSLPLLPLHTFTCRIPIPGLCSFKAGKHPRCIAVFTSKQIGAARI